MSDETLQLVQAVSAVGTPLLVLLVGFFLNRTMQLHAEKTRRATTWHENWANEFLQSASMFDHACSAVISTFWGSHIEATNPTAFPEFEENQKRLHLTYMPLVLKMYEADLSLKKYPKFATRTGSELEKATAELLSEVVSWASSRGGNMDRFIERQIEFSRCARNTHAELLATKR